jgi:hypothetical protein
MLILKCIVFLDSNLISGGLYTTTVEAFIPANGRAVQ